MKFNPRVPFKVAPVTDWGPLAIVCPVCQAPEMQQCVSVGPHDPEEIGTVHQRRVIDSWAAQQMPNWSVTIDGVTYDNAGLAKAAILERDIIEIMNRPHVTAEWPEDEQRAYADLAGKSFTAAFDAVEKLRAQKIIRRVQEDLK